MDKETHQKKKKTSGDILSKEEKMSLKYVHTLDHMNEYVYSSGDIFLLIECNLLRGKNKHSLKMFRRGNISMNVTVCSHMT